jgi:repressor LexA
MHLTQKKILRFLQKTKLSSVGYSQLGRFIDEPHPQTIKHHMEQLEEKGFITYNGETKAVKVLKPIEVGNLSLINLPIVGAANCGPAGLVAEEELEGYLKISPNVLDNKNPKGLFVIRAEGNSLNDAKKIPGGTVDDGDYVVVNGRDSNPSDGDYVLSVIDDCANLKRFYKKGDQIVLVSESKGDIPPIYIHSKDFPNYMVNGVVVRVIKKPKL